MKTEEELIDQYFKEKSHTSITQFKFAKKHNIIQPTFNKWLLKDHRYQRTKAKYTRKTYTKEEIKNKIDEFFKLNQETGISANKFAKKHNIIQPTFHSWLLKDPRYQRIQKNYSKDPTLDTWVKKQHLDELKEKNAETVYDSSTLIDKYPELEMLLDHTNDALPYNSVVLQLDQPDTSQMTPDLSWYSSQENLSMIQESLSLEDQPSTSRMTPELEMLLDHTNDPLPYNSEVLQLDQPDTSQMTPDLSWYSSQENLSMIQESLPLEDQGFVNKSV